MHPFRHTLCSNYDRQKFLFHYTSLETARDHILPSKALRFSQRIALNDPHESKNHHWIPISPAGVEPNSITDRIDDYYLRNVKVCCLSRDDPDAEPRDQFPLDLYALGHMKQRMWATYGHRHKGVCLVFDKQRLKAAFEGKRCDPERLFFGDVSYGRPTSEGLIESYSIKIKYFTKDFDAALRNLLDGRWRTHFLFKHQDWRTEFEYRFVLVGNRQQNEHLTYDDALVGIVLGMDVDAQSGGTIVQLEETQDIPIVQLPVQGFTKWNLLELNDAASKVMVPQP